MRHFAYVVGDHISTDLIHPPNFFSLDQGIRQQGLLYGYNPEWAKTIEPGSVIIAGLNFGCGSSREVTARVFADRKIKLVCALSFARIFYRNMVNLGIPIGTITSEIPWQEGSRVAITYDKQKQIISAKEGQHIKLSPPSPFARKIINQGGLLNSIDNIFQVKKHG